MLRFWFLKYSHPKVNVTDVDHFIFWRFQYKLLDRWRVSSKRKYFSKISVSVSKTARNKHFSLKKKTENALLPKRIKEKHFLLPVFIKTKYRNRLNVQHD